MARGFSILLIVLACLLIAWGRMRIRNALVRGGRAAFGWSLLLMGFILMIAGVVLW